MPTYRFLNKQTKEEWEQFMTISELDEFLKSNPQIEQLVNGFPGLGYSMVLRKPDDGFRDMMRRIKKANSKGMTKSTIDII